MEHQFWHEKWRNHDIGFHQKHTNPWLLRHISQLLLPDNGRLFLPLCGKTRDIDWLLKQGLQVVGCELNQSAVEQLFHRLGMQPDIQQTDRLTLYRAASLDIWVGDFFELSKELLGTIDAVFDRAALVALPGELRARYASHLTTVTRQARQLLICFEYQQAALSGPPFSVTAEEVSRLYSGIHSISRLSASDVPGGLKGQCPATEVCWLLN